MQTLNFSDFTFRFKQQENTILIFDEIRRKFVVLTPEEWVRQHVVHHLIYEKKYPKSHINVEKKISLNGLTKRYDVVVFNADGSYQILVECKAPQVTISQTTFDQIARYNMVIEATFLMVTNGLNHYFCQIDYHQKNYHFISDLPTFNTQKP
uniref:type I restriction enzyme HsdR N-terminal domain-containing protein n=1 Tax=Flavobacterium sp. TaxID=239 RepID=UPI00404953B4